MPGTKPRIVYVMGGGRCGTTLLDIILGNLDGAYSIGEIFKWPMFRGIPHNATDGDKNDQFWGRVREEFSDGMNESWEELEHVSRRLEYHSFFVKVLLGLNSNRASGIYARYVQKLFELIRRESGRDILVDSSKYPARALSLSRIDGIDISVVYIKRDPVKVIASFQKKDLEQPPKPVLVSLLYYILVNLTCKLAVFVLRRQGRRVIELTYEDVITRPADMVRSVSGQLDIGADELLELLENNKPLPVGTLFEGNRIRLADELAIDPGLEKNPELPLPTFVVRLFTWWLY